MSASSSRVLRAALASACILCGCRRDPTPVAPPLPDPDVVMFPSPPPRPSPPVVRAPPVADVPPAPPPPPPPPSRPSPAVGFEPGEIAAGGYADLPGQPIACSGDRVIFLDGISIDHPTGPAVRASGRCAVRLSNCTLRGDIGVLATERATVHLTRCRVSGATHSVDVAGYAAVRLTGCALNGPTRQVGHASIDGS